ncbi:ribose transport system substrate-binding protein [Cohaesibacter sp. ES.047]|uniref:sugar ABC transporter substrate-binding protein n=1 Tax=Cohaesibacter sp. ES.047 TaxID=1798205 RepID=UPI000BB91C63|nr:sugar ABC transporter substrate-binding protein [Cohaesibacter sp. ES.047]SNY90246.1 ribose transport system substrate-binding protein [Cohaesibacter sp. ES.047]
MWSLTKRSLMGAAAAMALVMSCGSVFAEPALPDGGSVKALPNDGKPLRIAFMGFQNNPFWIPVVEGAHAATKYLAEFNTQVDYSDLGDGLTTEAVIAGIESAIAQQYDGIVVVPIFDGTERAINEAVDSGIPVINIIAEGSVPSKRLLFIGQNSTQAGQQLGEFIAKRMNGEGKLGVITGYFGAVQHTQRMNGAIDYLKEEFPDVQILGPYENQDRAEVAYSQVQDMYTANPDLKMVYVTAGGPYGAARAVKDLGKTGEIGVVGFDHTPDNVAYVKSGEMVGLIDQAPFQQAFDATVMMHNYLISGKKPNQDVMFLKGNLMTPENLDK